MCKPTCVWDSQHSCTQCFNLGADPEYCNGRLGVWEMTKCKCANNYVRARAATDQGRQAIRFCCAQKPQRQFRHMQVRSFSAMRTKARSPMGGSWYSRVATHAQKQFVKTQRTPHGSRTVVLEGKLTANSLLLFLFHMISVHCREISYNSAEHSEQLHQTIDNVVEGAKVGICPFNVWQ